MTDKSERLFDIDNRIAAVMQQLGELIERSQAITDTAAEADLMREIEDRETELTALREMREALAETAD